MVAFLALPNFDYTLLAPPPCQLGQSLTLGRVKEFAYVTMAFAPLPSFGIFKDN